MQQQEPPPSQAQAHNQVTAQRSEDGLSHSLRGQVNRDKSAEFNLLARALEPYTSHGLSSQSPTSVPQESAPTAASASSNPDLQNVNDGEQSGSYGTLMLSKGGRSKYLGPTAGSEWLKDVSYFSTIGVERAELF